MSTAPVVLCVGEPLIVLPRGARRGSGRKDLLAEHAEGDDPLFNFGFADFDDVLTTDKTRERLHW
jgi:hypothetical protein